MDSPLLSRRRFLGGSAAIVSLGALATLGSQVAGKPRSVIGPAVADAEGCLGVYECDAYFYITDVGVVFFCVDLCDIMSGEYCETDCYECG